MSSVAAMLGQSYDRHPLRDAFLKWQCHVRQMMMRDKDGRPSEGVTPDLTLPSATEPMGAIITILNKSPGFSVTPEMQHMFRKTNDPAQVRESAIKFLSASFYQKHREFSDILTATFLAGSEGAKAIHGAGRATLTFSAYNQEFTLDCKVWRLAPHNPLHEATIAHNRLFNPNTGEGTEVLGFEPDWAKSSANPPVGGAR